MSARATVGAPVVIAVVIVLAALVAAGPAWAGQWMQVSCVNPGGAAASNQGWTGSAAGAPTQGSDNDVTCGPGQPMSATLSANAPSPGAYELLTYTPPAGSTLAGGTLEVTLSADGHSQATSPSTASGAAGVLAPGPGVHPADEVTFCAFWTGGCWHGSEAPFQTQADWSGSVAVPSDVGGTLTVFVGCLTTSGECETGANGNVWASATMSQADLLLASSASPEGTGFSGSALQPSVGGVAHLVFTASDPNGPGVFNVTADVDGHPVYSATPNTNNAQCVPVARDPSSGALMFDSQQPCPSTQVIDVPVPTAQLPDGTHELAISVTDAASNTSTVFDQQITTRNPSLTPTPRGRKAVRAQFALSWRWAGARTRLLDLTSSRLPRGGEVLVSCAGRGCPRLRIRRVATKDWARMRRELVGRTFTAGDRLYVTVTAPRRRAERILIQIRDSAKPSARLL